MAEPERPPDDGDEGEAEERRRARVAIAIYAIATGAVVAALAVDGCF
jgi:hypothetical protein